MPQVNRLERREGEPHGQSPLLYVDSANQYAAKIRRFDPSRYASNHHLMQTLLGLTELFASSDTGPIIKTVFHPIDTIEPDEVYELVGQIGQSPSVADTLQNEFPGSSPIPIQEGSDSDLHIYFNNMKGSGSIIAPDHIVDVPLLNLIKSKGVFPQQTACIIFDAHCDAGDGKLNKASFIRHLIDKGIGRVSLFGLEAGFSKNITQGRPILPPDVLARAGGAIGVVTRDIDLTAHDEAQYYSENRGRFGIYGSPVGQKGNLDASQVHADIHDEIVLLRRMGIRNVWISADVDVLNLLNESVTATHFNPVSRYINFSRLDVMRSLQSFFADMKFGIDIQDCMKMLVNPITKELFSEMREQGGKEFKKAASLYGPFINTALMVMFMSMNNLDFGERVGNSVGLTNLSAHGLTLEDLCGTIELIKGVCKANEIEFGVPVNNRGGRITGTISEAWGLDLNGNTARAVKQIYEAMNS